MSHGKKPPQQVCTIAFTTEVKQGWLDNTYGAAARKAWFALISYIDANADIQDVCEGTRKKNDRHITWIGSGKLVIYMVMPLFCGVLLLRCLNKNE